MLFVPDRECEHATQAPYCVFAPLLVCVDDRLGVGARPEAVPLVLQLQVLATGQASRGHEVEVVVAAPGTAATSRVEGGVLVIRAARFGTLRSVPVSPGLVTS